ncbi:ArsR/SmtB family transcription factor [Cellulomonas sp. 179-A 9B4 NHS]|uniref:ArsR/SmtB family transcription factor n=1 Tax=Cellulomonas sp. 179-A 9B4 NHS TaxID=3142379 RepID=UPI0039A08E05
MDALGDPVRRRLVELLADGERPAGDLAAAVGAEHGISQPAVSRHLRVLREAGVVTARPRGPVRLYAVQASALDEVGAWADAMTRHWRTGLDALATEVARGRVAARDGAPADDGAGPDGTRTDGARQAGPRSDRPAVDDARDHARDGAGDGAGDDHGGGR